MAVAFRYDEVVPWGRSHEEYLRMFALRDADLGRRLLGCGDGPASFNREWTRRGGRVLSVDPLYALPAPRIAQRIDETYEDVIAQTRREQRRFVWDRIGSVDDLGRLRMAAMQAFLEDYAQGRHDGRYLAGALPSLPFRDSTFELILSSHLLFFYAAQLSREFHREAVRELLRVAPEVRIFPVVDVNGQRSLHLDPLLAELRATGVHAELREVDYEFQRGGCHMLHLSLFPAL